jgi:hypothetical protein
MESLRWWFLLVAAVMFSMAGCAAKEGWTHPTTAPSSDEPKIITLAH